MPAPKIVFLDASTVGNTPMDEISALGDLILWPVSSREEALERVADCEVLIINKVRVDAALMDAAPGLRLICEAATGVNNIDLYAAEERGIPVRNVAGYSTESVVQTTFMHMLSLLGDAQRLDAYVKDGSYSKSPIFTNVDKPMLEICGRKIGIIGMGAIGTRVAEVAHAFGMEVCYFSTSGTSHCKEYPSVKLDELMGSCDVISIHAPLNERTKGLIGARELSLMKPEAIIINAGRGGIIDEAALAEAINRAGIGGAALDVFGIEPLPADSPLLHTAHPELLRFSPHTAWAGRESLQRLVSAIAENIRKGF